jgi:uncharacterized protein (TIGR03084 family)
MEATAMAEQHPDEIFADLRAEVDRLESILGGLDAAAWAAPSGAAGWRVVDVLLHLAQTEEAVLASLTTSAGGDRWERDPGSLDAVMDSWVQAERAAPEVVFPRWQAAHRAALDALRRADPGRTFRWAAAPLKARSLATTRLAEHWAHGLDITGPLGIPFPDTDRLRHVAWLGSRSLPYAFALAGEPAAAVRCELTGPDGTTWRYGPPGAGSAITGSAGAFCRVGARRLDPADSGLVATGPHGRTALHLLRNYAA